MKILLTGATGFLGTELLANFLARNYQVLITIRRSTNLDSIFQRFGKLETWDVEQLDSLFTAHPNLDAIIHAATDYGRDESNPTATFWANEVFPIKLLTLAVQHKIALFINIDTFFNTPKVSYDYLGAYTLSKRHFQEWGQHCASSGKVGFSNLRLFHLYGPGDGREKFVPNIVARCLEGGEIDLTDGTQGRDFIHIKDAVCAVSTVLEAEVGRSVGYRHYDVGSGDTLSIRTFVEMIKRLCCSNAKLNFAALPRRDGEFQHSCAETTALRRLGWIPRVGIQEGILTVVKDVSDGIYMLQTKWAER